MTAPHNRFQNWPGANVLPGAQPGGTVIDLYFWGLLDFGYKREADHGSCEVGFLRADGRHRPKIEIFENGTRIDLGLPGNFRSITVGIRSNSGDKPAETHFLKDDSDQDFRWVLDLDNEEFYPENFPKNQNAVFAAKLTVRHGTFYAYTRTEFLINRVTRIPLDPLELLPLSALPTLSLDHPADIVGAKIALTATEYLSIIVDGHEARLPIDAAKHYEVLFTNLCFENNGDRCGFDWSNRHESQRNDFHFHRDILTLPALRLRYSVALGETPPEHDPPRIVFHLVNTPEAPCMGAGSGGTMDGFPSS